jgi:hypothetical protein
MWADGEHPYHLRVLSLTLRCREHGIFKQGFSGVGSGRKNGSQICQYKDDEYRDGGDRRNLGNCRASLTPVGINDRSDSILDS